MSDHLPKGIPSFLWFILGLLVATVVFESLMVSQLQSSLWDLRETMELQADMIRAAKGVQR